MIIFLLIVSTMVILYGTCSLIVIYDKKSNHLTFEKHGMVIKDGKLQSQESKKYIWDIL